jgi:muramidase (phage lysozyme)
VKRQIWQIVYLMAGVICAVGAARADQFSMLGGNTFVQSNGSLFQNNTGPALQPGTGSLFSDRSEGSLFAALPVRDVPRQRVARLGVYASPVVKVREIIGRAESRRNGYDAVQHGAKVRPQKRPTQMTIGEIYSWIDATPGQPHAIGRYQFIPKTLRRLVDRMALDKNTVFSATIQDQLSDILLSEAGYGKFRAGEITRQAFMNNLAKIWAGLPTSSGKSYYDGYAGNKASMSWKEFDTEMAKIFPS